MKIYPYQTPEGVIELIEKREYDKLLELDETRRQTAQNYYQQSLASEDRATKNLREVERLEQALHYNGTVPEITYIVPVKP